MPPQRYGGGSLVVLRETQRGEVEITFGCDARCDLHTPSGESVRVVRGTKAVRPERGLRFHPNINKGGEPGLDCEDTRQEEDPPQSEVD